MSDKLKSGSAKVDDGGKEALATLAGVSKQTVITKTVNYEFLSSFCLAASTSSAQAPKQSII